MSRRNWSKAVDFEDFERYVTNQLSSLRDWKPKNTKHTFNNRSNTKVSKKEMPSTQSPKDNHNKNSTQIGNRRPSLVVNNILEN